MGMSYGSLPTPSNGHVHKSEGNQRVFRLHHSEDDKSKPLMAVIITLNSHGSSYDQLFQSQKQVPPEGGRVSVWQMNLTDENMNEVRDALEDRKNVTPQLKELFEEIDQVEPKSTVFNFECCSPCSEQGFGGELDVTVMSALAEMLHHGFFVMFSDFSLKALLKSWNTTSLGPCPFKQVGGYSSNCELRFISNNLKECASAQLATVGQLCENGEAHVHAMGGTIAFAPLKNMDLSQAPYTLNNLTVISKADGCAPSIEDGDCETLRIGDYQGYVGHALLQYNTGGNLLLSSCHWVELSHLSTSEENVFNAFAQNQGTAYAEERRAEYNAMPVAARSMKLQSFARAQVQSAAPCSYSSLPMKKGT